MNEIMETPALERIENMRSKLKRIRRKLWLVVIVFAIIGIVMMIAGICASIRPLSLGSIAPFALASVLFIVNIIYEAKTEEQIKEIVFNEITSGRR